MKGYGNFVPMTGTPEDHARQLRQWRDRPFEHVPAPPPAVVDEFAQQRGRALASGACALLLAVGVAAVTVAKVRKDASCGSQTQAMSKIST